MFQTLPFIIYLVRLCMWLSIPSGESFGLIFFRARLQVANKGPFTLKGICVTTDKLALVIVEED